MASLHYDNRYSFHVSRSTFSVYLRHWHCALAMREASKRYARRPYRSSGRGMPAYSGEPPFRGGRASGWILALASRRRRTRAKPSTYKRRGRPAALCVGPGKGRALKIVKNPPAKNLPIGSRIRILAFYSQSDL